MKMLYISVHEPLLHDEAGLFLELGAEVDVGSRRGNLPRENRFRPDVGRRVTWNETTLGAYDIIVVMHDPASLQRVHAARRPGQRIVWRTIGQSSPATEQAVLTACPGVEIVRYSPRERNSPVFAGETALIRFYKDEAEHSGWTGGGGINLLSIGFGRRGLPDHPVVEAALEGHDWALWGPNDDHPRGRGTLAHGALVPMLRSSDLFFASHSMPASYTLNLIEGLMTGCPVASIGRRVIEAHPDHLPAAPGYPAAMFEADEILDHGRCGLLVDDPAEGRAQIRRLLSSPALAQDLSEAGRARAIELFGKARIAGQWREFLGLG